MHLRNIKRRLCTGRPVIIYSLCRYVLKYSLELAFLPAEIILNPIILVIILSIAGLRKGIYMATGFPVNLALLLGSSTGGVRWAAEKSESQAVVESRLLAWRDLELPVSGTTPLSTN